MFVRTKSISRLLFMSLLLINANTAQCMNSEDEDYGDCDTEDIERGALLNPPSNTNTQTSPVSNRRLTKKGILKRVAAAICIVGTISAAIYGATQITKGPSNSNNHGGSCGNSLTFTQEHLNTLAKWNCSRVYEIGGEWELDDLKAIKMCQACAADGCAVLCNNHGQPYLGLNQDYNVIYCANKTNLFSRVPPQVMNESDIQPCANSRLCTTDNGLCNNDASIVSFIYKKASNLTQYLNGKVKSYTCKENLYGCPIKFVNTFSQGTDLAKLMDTYGYQSASIDEYWNQYDDDEEDESPVKQLQRHKQNKKKPKHKRKN